ncbi:hypothetical protein B0H14DRAFT_2607178 [Mycena olivaceomarginata]|nr:hypothetical protein B0H14DRAFT_2607178 [Mycena olivaceomarginata]
MSDVGRIYRSFSTPPQYVFVMSSDSSSGVGERKKDVVEATTRLFKSAKRTRLMVIDMPNSFGPCGADRLTTFDTHSTMEEFSARMDDITAKVEALTARMDTLSPSLPRADSQRTPPSQIEAPTPPRPFSFASADKGFGFLNPSPTNEGGTSAAPQPFSYFSTLAQDFGLPKQSQPRTDIFTPPNPGLHGLFGPPNPASHGLFGSPNPASHGPFGSLNPAAHGKDSSSSKSSQRMNDIAAAIAADFMQLSVKHSQAISAAMIADTAELHRYSVPVGNDAGDPDGLISDRTSCGYRIMLRGRKTAGAFSKSAAFGGVQQQLTNIFSVFGGGTSQPTTGGFGAFGNPAPAATAARAFGTGAFSQPQQQQQQPAPGIGAFGQPQQSQQKQPSIFGGGTTNRRPEPALMSRNINVTHPGEIRPTSVPEEPRQLSLVHQKTIFPVNVVGVCAPLPLFMPNGLWLLWRAFPRFSRPELWHTTSASLPAALQRSSARCVPPGSPSTTTAHDTRCSAFLFSLALV